jgi:hypothetical protein
MTETRAWSIAGAGSAGQLCRSRDEPQVFVATDAADPEGAYGKAGDATCAWRA